MQNLCIYNLRNRNKGKGNGAGNGIPYTPFFGTDIQHDYSQRN